MTGTNSSNDRLILRRNVEIKSNWYFSYDAFSGMKSSTTWNGNAIAQSPRKMSALRDISNTSDIRFLAATKQLYKWYFPSVCPSVCPSLRLSVCLSHLFHHVPIIVSSWNFQELLPWSKVMSMQKVKVRGQRSRSQRSRPNLTVSGL